MAICNGHPPEQRSPLPRSHAPARSPTTPGVRERKPACGWITNIGVSIHALLNNPTHVLFSLSGGQVQGPGYRAPASTSSPRPPRTSAGDDGRDAPGRAGGLPSGSISPGVGGFSAGADGEVHPEFEEGSGLLSGENPDSPLNRLRNRRSYWQATMRQMGTLGALTLSIITSGYQMEWDPVKGPAPPVHLLNHNSALA